MTSGSNWKSPKGRPGPGEGQVSREGGGIAATPTLCERTVPKVSWKAYIPDR